MGISLFVLPIVMAYVIDLALGDPAWLYHPVILIGKLINILERFLGRLSIAKYLQGVLLTLITVGVTGIFTGAVYIIIASILRLTWLKILLSALIIWTSFSNRCLGDEVSEVYNALANRDIDYARTRLQRVVGRDASVLSENEIIRAAVETLSENLIDGFVSPLFYATLGTVISCVFLTKNLELAGVTRAFYLVNIGEISNHIRATDLFNVGNIEESFYLSLAPLFAMVYKAVNTLDSMVGYKNEKYIDLGRFSAKTDDVFNFIPARIGSILIILTGLVSGRNGIRVFIRDRRKHTSPNCAFPESAFSGILKIKLGGSHIYFGNMVYKPTIGEDKRNIDFRIIKEAIRLMYGSSFVNLMSFLAIILVVASKFTMTGI